MTKEMSKRITSLFLALIMILQILIPQNIFAEEEKNLPQDKYVKVGMIDGKSYDAKIMNELNRIAAKNRKQGPINIGTSLFSSGPYFGDNNEPKDADKPKYFGNVSAKLDLVGLDGNPFQWNEIFGVDESGNSKPAQIIFRQMDAESSVDTGLYYMLQITKEGKYTWSDGEGKPTKLPLFSKSLKPYKYEVRIDERVSDKVKLLTEVIFGTEGSSPTFSPENADGEIIANITLGLTYQQIASTKFKSEWHTGVAEAKRPDIKANFAFDDEGDGLSPVSVALPKNDKDTKIIRDWYNEFDPDLVISYYLEKTPDVKIDETTAGLTFEDKNGVKTVTSGDHKFKYDFKYDVINGGKLTMTEVIPITFDANGGKFANFTDPDTEKQIVKEVEYDGTLTEKPENPTKDRETFKGWSTTADGKTPATDADFKNITKAKTFYAIWDNNDITAEELTVHESFKDGDTWVNNFIPTLDQLKGQVKIKGANGNPQALADTDTFEILNDSNTVITGDTLKDYLYGKLQEKNDGNKPSRQETVTAKVTHANGTSQKVEIPIKVIKNIYEGTSIGEKPSYVPENYVKVTVDPTDKATNSQKTYYYVNPAAKVVIPGSNPTGTGDNVFTKWLIKGTTEEYKLADKPRHMFTAETTIEAQYDKEQQGKIKIKYVDENGNEISSDYHIDGVDYPKTKEGKLGDYAKEEDFPKPGPDFKGYIYDSRDSIKGKQYKDSAYPDKLDTVTYKYTKKVTTDDKSQSGVYFPVVFDANKGAFTGGETKVTVYVYFNGNDATVEKVTFKEVREAVEEKYGEPSKANENFIEWQDKVDKGSAVADNYEIQFKGWDSEYNPTGDTFYAHYGKASALISYLDLDGKAIADDYKIDTEKYPTEKEGKLDDPIAKDVFTAETAPKLIGYKFNRIELNPANGKYALDNKATIKIYYEKLPDIIPSTGNDKPDGYVTVTFEPGTNGTLDGETKFYVNPKADPAKTMAEITQPTIKANQGFKVADPKWKDAEDNALATATKITKDLTYTAQYTGLDDIIPDTTPDDDTDKPDRYVTVKFLPGDHGTLGGTTKYYVNPKADPVKTMNDITEPTVTPNTNYEVDTPKWKDASNVELYKTTEIKTDLTYTAQYKFTKDVVPQGPGEGKPVVPDNYVKVTFKEGEYGVISASQTTIYWVKPDKEVTLTAPAVTANVDYKHVAWTYKVNDQDKTTSGADATTSVKDTFAVGTDITAQYKKKVVPGPDQPNVPGTTNPDNEYVKVEFVAKDHGKIKDGETKEYWVLKDETVELKTPAVEAKTNYAFKEWKEPVQTSYSKDTTHNAVFAYTGENVVPQKPGDEKPDVPADFVQVIFNQGTNGTIANTETITYWVNPKVKVTVTAPKVEANDGYKHVTWTYGPKEETNLQSVTDKFTEKTTITAKYLKKVLKEEPTTDKDAYVEVKFNAESNGKLPEDKIVKSYWVLKDTPVTLTEPTVTANPGWKFIKYDPAVKTSYSQDTEHKAQYKKIIETKDPKDKDYVKVTFDPGKQGSIKAGSNAEIWVLKDETIDPTAITPQLEVKTGYAFKEWTPVVQTSYSEDTKHVASYTYNGKDVVPQKPGEDKPNVPNNFVKVTFVAGEHGSIANTETYIFWVNPAKEVTLNAPKVTANADYKQMAWTYGTKEETNLQSVTDTFTEKETTITAKYLKKVVTEDPKDTENYVKVDFKADADDQSPARGSLEGTKTYWVLKNTDVKFDAPKVTPNSGYTFTEWNPAVKTNYDTDTTHTAQYKLKEKVLTENPNDPDYIKVTFNANGGKIGVENTKDLWVLKGIATFADAKAKVADPTKEKATFKEWQDKASEGTAVEGTKILSKADETFYAAWTNKGKIIDVTDPNQGPDPEYVRLTFKAGEGTFGKDAENKDITEKQIDVLKDTSYTDEELLEKIKGFEDSAIANTPTKKFNAWDKQVPKTGLVATETFTAQYVDKDKIIDVEDPTVDPKEGYVRLTFDATTDGKIDTKQTKAIDVLSSLKYSDKDLQAKITSIKAVPNDSNKVFDKWNPDVPTDDTDVTKQTYTAIYKDKDKNIIPATGNEKPDGYVTVRFLTNKNGTLTGETTYYVNPKAGKTMKEITAPTITANDGYKVGSPKWKPDFTKDNSEIKEDRNYVANYDSLGKAEITYISMDTNMGTVSPASEAIYENQNIVGSTATAKDGYKFVKWTDVTGKQVSTDANFVPSKKESATYIAVFKAKDPVTFTVNKVWADDVNPVPTMNFTLYRKVAGGQDEAVPGADVKGITKTNTEATWTNLPKEDSQGKPYTYSVKETFKDQNDVKNDNWILGTMEDDGNGNKTITNKLKTVPGTGDTLDENQHRMGKLTITKKIESKVTQPQMAMFSSGFKKAPAAPMEFTFKVTDPYGKVVKVDGQDTFTLKANETKTLENLLYGEYTVEETDAKGLTPFVKVGEGAEAESKTGKVTLKKDAKTGTVTFTNKNVNSLTNPNVIEVKASKVWENGPSTDHAAVTLKLYRQVGNEAKVEVTGVTPEVTRVVSGDPTFNYVWKNLPKINDDGKEYTYIVEEAGVTDGKVTVGDGEDARTYVVTQKGNTITNTYEVPKTDKNVIGKKEWSGVPTGTTIPTVKLELWRKTSVNPDGEKAVEEAMALTNNQADFGKQDKTDENGNKYTYFVKEVFDDANEKAKWTLSGEGTLELTNTYKTKPAPVTYTVTFDNKGHGTKPADQKVEAGKTATEPTPVPTAEGFDFGGWYTDENFEYKYDFATPVYKDRTLYAKWTAKPVTPEPKTDGKLSITKKLENVPARMMMMRGPAVNADPIKFTFTVTKPDGTSENFELAANESKTLDNLAYGEYTIKETDTKGYTPFYALGKEEAKQAQEFKVTINSADEVKVTVTNKNIINQNDLTVRATKIWVGGPETDHTAVELTLKRLSAKSGSNEEDVTNAYKAETINNTSDSITYVWKNLPKHDGEGYAYTYRVEELGTVSDPTSTDKIYTVGSNKYVSKIEEDAVNTANETIAFKITNTYVVPKTDDIVATKKWIGVPDGTETPEVKFQLQRTANGKTEVVGQAMDLTNNQANFGKQDKTDANGVEYIYSVKEVKADGSAFNLPNYTSEVNGLTVTNTYHAPEVKYTVTYEAGSSTATGTMNPVTVAENTNHTVLANGFTNPGYTFKGWKLDNGTIVQPGATITVTANVTLTAQWEKTTTPPTPDPDKPNPDKPNPWNPDYPKPWNPNYPEIRYETIVQEKIVKVPVPIADNAYVKEVRYMQGFMGDFRPKDGLTRAEAAQILANALVEDGYKYNKDFKLPYKDIGEAWYTRAVKIVTEAKVFAGYDDGNFKPQDKITRNEWIATLKRFQELGDVSGNHMKLKDGHWAMAEIEAAYKEGWLKIYSDGLATYEGDKFIPREEVAAVSNKAFNRVLDKTYIINNDKNLITYKDVKKDMWSYEDILCASNTFLYKKDLYRAHWIKEDNNLFNINTDGFEIVKAKFQRNPR